MKVLYVCSSIPSRGIHHYASMLPRAASRLGIDARVISSPGEADPGVRKRLWESNIDVIDLPRPERRGPRSMWESARFLGTVLTTLGIDVVHTFGFASALRCWLAQRLFPPQQRVPIVVSLEAMRHGRPEESLARIVASQVFNRIPCVVCALSSTELRKMRRAGLREARVRLLPNWVDYEDFTENSHRHDCVPLPFAGMLDGRAAVTYLANFIPRKGHRYLIEAASEVVGMHPECLFVLAGEGPEMPQMRALAVKLGIANHALFPGRLPADAIPALLKSVQIGVVASLAETFGWAIVEPLLADRPVVTTDVGFAADLAAAGGVLMVPKRDPLALAEGLATLVQNPQLRQQIASRGKAFVLENCEIRKVSQRYLEIYEECLA